MTFFATLIAAASFVWGINAWRTAFLGQKRIALAEEVYELTLLVADHVRAIRNPVGYLGEGTTRKRGEHETEKQREIFDNAYVAIERYDARKEDFFKLYSLMPRFTFYFGPGAEKPVREFGDIIHDIQFASERLRHYWMRQGGRFGSENEFNEHLKAMWEAEAIFWHTHHEEDPIRPRVEEIVRKVEGTCRRAIDPKPNLWWAMKLGLIRFSEFLRIPPDIRDRDRPEI